MALANSLDDREEAVVVEGPADAALDPVQGVDSDLVRDAAWGWGRHEAQSGGNCEGH